MAVLALFGGMAGIGSAVKHLHLKSDLSVPLTAGNAIILSIMGSMTFPVRDRLRIIFGWALAIIAAALVPWRVARIDTLPIAYITLFGSTAIVREGIMLIRARQRRNRYVMKGRIA